MCTVLAVPFADNLRKVLTKRRNLNPKYKPVIALVSLGMALGVAGFGVAAYLAYEKIDDKTSIWHLAVAVACLSLSWCSSVQRAIMESNVEEEPEEEPDDPQSIDNLARTTSTQQSSLYGSAGSTRNDVTRPPRNPNMTHRKKSTWKTSIISHAVKIPCVCVFSFLLFYLDESIYERSILVKKATSEFEDAWNGWISQTEFADFLTNILTSFMGYILAFIACHCSMQKFGFALPLLLSFPGYALALFIRESCRFVLDGVKGACDEKNIEPLWLFITGAVLLELGVILSTSWFLFRNEQVILQKESQVKYSSESLQLKPEIRF